MADSGGLGEEPGWRGFALPRLLQFMGPLPAALTLGAVWGVWHIPAFLAEGGLAQSNFGLFLVSAVAMTVFMTWIYVHANGNFLVAGVIPHLIANLIGDAHVLARDPDLIEAVVFVALAAIIVLAYGPSLQGLETQTACAGLTDADRPQTSAKSYISKSGRISISLGPGIRLGQRFTQATASSMSLTVHSPSRQPLPWSRRRSDP